MTEITHQETPEDGDRPRVLGFTEKETYGNSGPENRKLIDAEAEAVHMILNGIGNDIYSIVDACPNVEEMWIAIERLQQGESSTYKMSKQSCYGNFANVQFLQQLQPEWSRFVTIVKQANNLDNVSYHTLFDILN
ncbi:hypothetical protein Tco_0945804 [Tanacetum coccineum]